MESLNDRRNWHFRDPNEGVPLEFVESLSSRAYSLVARSTSVLLQSHFMQIGGVACILSGLTYHHDNFVAHVASLMPRIEEDYEAIRHEAVAWVGRVGQLYYFARSQLVETFLGRVAIPAIENVIPFVTSM